MLTQLNFCALIILIIGCNVATGQTNTQETIKNLVKEKTHISLEKVKKSLEVQRLIREAIHEKTRFTQEQIQQALQNKKQNNEVMPSYELHKSHKQQILTNNEVVVSGDGSFESEIHAAINPKDSSNIVVSPISNTIDPLAGLMCPIYYTKDFGKTWKKSNFQTKPKEPTAITIGGGDPMFAFDADGKLYLSWINLYIANFSFDIIYEDMSWAYSTDGGASWTREAGGVIGKTSIVGQNETEFFDKQWMMVDQTNSPYRGNLYAGIFNPSGTDQRIGLRRKDAKSVEFTKTTVRPVGDDYSLNQFTSVDIDGDGGVHLTYLGDKAANKLHPALYHAVSHDGGKTLEPEVKITDLQIQRFSIGQESDSIVGIQASRLYPCPHFIIDKSAKSSFKGNCYMVWTANGVTKKEANGLDIYFSSSSDNGETWDTPKIINDDVKGKQIEQYYPTISVNPKGVVCIAWYDRRNDANNINTDVFMTFSFDGGKNFIKNFVVTQSPTDFSTVGLLNNGFGIGDYNEMISTENYAIPFWGDARNNDGDMNLYAAFVPISSTTDVPDKIIPLSQDYELYDVYPNPSGATTKVGFRLTKPSKVKLEVTDITGKKIATLYEADEKEGEYFTVFDAGTYEIGSYFIKLTTNSGYTVKKLMISR